MSTLSPTDHCGSTTLCRRSYADFICALLSAKFWSTAAWMSLRRWRSQSKYDCWSWDNLGAESVNSTGNPTLILRPMWISYGDNLRSVWLVALRHISHSGRTSSISKSSFAYHFNRFDALLTKDSHIPLVRGDLALLIRCLIPNIFTTQEKNLLQKEAPRSEITISGIPHLVITSLKNTLAVVSALKSLTPFKIGQPE